MRRTSVPHGHSAPLVTVTRRTLTVKIITSPAEHLEVLRGLNQAQTCEVFSTWGLPKSYLKTYIYNHYNIHDIKIIKEKMIIMICWIIFMIFWNQGFDHSDFVQMRFPFPNMCTLPSRFSMKKSPNDMSLRNTSNTCSSLSLGSFHAPITANWRPFSTWLLNFMYH